MLVVGIRFIFNWMTTASEGKLDGPYYSSLTIEEAKKQQVWLATYSPDSKRYFSYNKTDSIELAEVWVEKNNNDKQKYWMEADYEFILNIFFKRLTDNRLHKFRLITSKTFKLDDFKNDEYPDGYHRVRFLITEIKDTINLLVLERNPEDSLAWLTEKSIDTITLIRKKQHTITP